MKKHLILTGVVILSLFTGCSKKINKGNIIARIGDEVFTIYDLKAELSMFKKSDLRELGRNPKMASFFVNSLIDRWKMYVYAKKLGMDKDANIRALVRSYETRLLQRRLMNKETKKISVSFREVKNYYNSVKEKRYTSSERIRVRQINVKTKKKLKEVLEKLKKGEDFGKLAKIYNNDPMLKKNRGDLGYIGKKILPREVEKVAWQMSQPLKISKPIRTKKGFTIIQYLDRITKSYTPLERVYNDLLKELKKKKETDIYNDFKKRVNDNVKVDVNYELISKFINRTAKAAGLKIGPKK